MIKINIAYASKVFVTLCLHISIGSCTLQSSFGPTNRVSRYGTENRCRPPFRILTAILRVCSFMLSAISRFKFLYAYVENENFLKVTGTGYTHGIKIYHAINLHVTECILCTF